MQKVQLIIEGGGQARQTIEITHNDIEIGSDPDNNDVVLCGNGVSKKHARIVRNWSASDKYEITDLGSAGGTFLDDTRLLDNVKNHLPFGETVRIGEYRLRLEAHDEEIEKPPESTEPAPLAAVSVDPPTVSVQAGSSISLQVHLQNQSSIVQHFQVRIRNIPDEWVTSPAAPIHLMPDERGQTTITFKPPRLPTSTAGVHHFLVSVMSAGSEGEIASAAGSLEIAPFAELDADFKPKRLRKADAHTQVSLTNQGNAPLAVTLEMRDREEWLDFKPQTCQVKIQPANTEEVSVLVVPPKQPLFGPQQRYSFEVLVKSAAGDQTLTDGAIELQGFPVWLAGVLVALCIIVGIAAVPIISGINSSNATQRATAQSQTAAAQMTGTAVAASCQVKPTVSAPTGDSFTASAAYEPFEGGFMIWRADNDDTIYVLLNDCTAMPYNSPVGLLDNPVTDPPPAGRTKPVSGFGKIWGNKPDVRKALGWALGNEQGYTATISPFKGLTKNFFFLITLPDGRKIVVANQKWNYS